jgi:eukaryotic-like serine/threonine-protein kinase
VWQKNHPVFCSVRLKEKEVKMKRRNVVLVLIITLVIIIVAVGILMTKGHLLGNSNGGSATLGIGSSKVSKIDGMRMVYVPAGEFYMGYQEYTASDPRYDLQFPKHIVALDSYWMDKTEVTNAMFSKFVDATGYVTEAEKRGNGHVALPKVYWKRVDGASWENPLGPDSNIKKLKKHPVVQVSWNDANAYCQWAGRRLPTEAEWEKAARGLDLRIYPWGNTEWTGELANLPDKNFAQYIDFAAVKSEVDDGYTYTAPVGSYPKGASPYGVLDMAGNVWEWVYDWIGKEYISDAPAENPSGPSSGVMRVIRGMSWDIDYGESAIYRQNNWPDQSSASLGFRCAVSAEK